MITIDDLIPTEFQVVADFSDLQQPVVTTFCRMNSPFYSGERWCVKRGGTCLNKKGEWEFEPRPSARDDEFYDRCRFETLQESVNLYNSTEKGENDDNTS